MIILLILSIILLSIGLFLIYKANNIKNQRIEQINRQDKILQDKKTQITLLKQEENHLCTSICQNEKRLNILQAIKENINQEVLKQEESLKQHYQQKKQQINQEYQNYKTSLQLEYQLKEEENNIKLKQLTIKKESIESQIQEIKKIYQAAAADRVREKEKKDKQSFYRINISDKQISDISKLQQWKYNLFDPTIVAKIIWSSYIIKPTSNLCNRVLGSSSVCGIYKITNINTGDVYIGQSVNIADRFKQHIKCGLGIDASPTNKLYNNMQQFGVWNFTFEVLQKCQRSKLNDKERFWIDMYQSNKIGMNVTRGNK